MEIRRRKIILVDDNMATLTMGKNMLKTFYEVYPAPSAAKMFALLENVQPDLILLDIEMPEMDGYETIRLLKDDAKFLDTPVIFLTAKSDEGSELEGLNLGAVDYMSKPFSAPLLLKRIETHLLFASQKKELRKTNANLSETVFIKTRQVFDLENSVLNTVAELVEFRDSVTGGHVSRTQKYLQFLIEKLIEENIYQDEVSTWDLNFLLPSAQLHDVGKIAISDAILNKPGKLTEEEFETMKSHVVIGVDVIERIEQNTSGHEFLRHAKVIAGTHHEKWNGGGYPLGLSGRNIPLEGRLMAIADVYDALISRRPYKKPFTTRESERIIEEGRGTHFDPVLVDIFRMVSGKFAEIVEEYMDEETGGFKEEPLEERRIAV
ncbi:MAG: response regulator [Clostridiales Family XIII bacterium]|jgi:putative two-component system response regulator|nr:response regulator [Clostridiales Family XIII bacterium]